MCCVCFYQANADQGRIGGSLGQRESIAALQPASKAALQCRSNGPPKTIDSSNSLHILDDDAPAARAAAFVRMSLASHSARHLQFAGNRNRLRRCCGGD